MGTPSPYLHWFDTSVGMGQVSEGNRTQFFVSGEEAFADIADRLEADGGKDASAHLLGWSCDLDVPLRPPSPIGRRLSDLLAYFARQGGSVYAMLWDNTIMPDAGGCKAAVAFINALPWSGSHAILDHRTPLAGTHHQKLQIIVPARSKAGVPDGEPVPAVAYCGGMDLFRDRVGDGALHDVHCRLSGPVVDALLRVFQDRWNDHPDGSGTLLRNRVSTTAGIGSSLVQVCVTYPTFQSPIVYSVLVRTLMPSVAAALATASVPTAGDMTENGAVRYYRFYQPRRGVQQIWRAVKHAIGEAKRFIYLEDQYLTFRWVGEALADKLSSTDDPAFRIVIVALHPRMADVQQIWPRRRDVLARLKKVDPRRRRWTVVNRRLDRPHPYVHSKTWIFDDELVITGSANLDRRGYSYNSEVDVVVAGDEPTDSDLTIGAKTVAQDLRARLSAKHLGGKAGDHLAALPSLQRFFGDLRRTSVEVFDPAAEVGAPDSYIAKIRTSGVPLAQTALSAMPGRPEDWLWDYLEDPDAEVPEPTAPSP